MATLLPSSHRHLQRSPPLLAACLWLYEAGWRRAAMAQGRHEWSPAVGGGCFRAGGTRVWGQKTQVHKQKCCRWGPCYLLGSSEPPCRDPMGQHSPGLFARQNWAIPVDVTQTCQGAEPFNGKQAPGSPGDAMLPCL